MKHRKELEIYNFNLRAKYWLVRADGGKYYDDFKYNHFISIHHNEVPPWLELSLFPYLFDDSKYRNDLCSLCGKNVFNLWQFYTFLIWQQFLKSVLSVSYITFDTWRKFFRYYIPESVISSFQPDFLVPFLYISGNWNYPYF